MKTSLILFVVLFSCLAQAKIKKVWEKTVPGGMPYAGALDASGNLIILSCAFKSEDLQLTKLDPNGTPLWSVVHPGSCSADQYHDRTAQLQIRGDKIYASTPSDFLRFSSAGALEYEHKHTPHAGGVYTSLAFTPSDCPASAERIVVVARGQSVFIYAEQGSFIKEVKTDVSKILTNCVRLDCDNNLFVTGKGSIGSYSSKESKQLWSQKFESEEKWPGVGIAMDLLPKKGIVVTGLLFADNGPTVTRRYGMDGTPLWEAKKGAAGPYVWRYPELLRTDAEENAYVFSVGYKRPLLVKYSPQGKELWELDFPYGKVQAHLPDAAHLIAASNEKEQVGKRSSEWQWISKLFEVNVAGAPAIQSEVGLDMGPVGPTTEAPMSAPVLAFGESEFYWVPGAVGVTGDKMVIVKASLR